MVRRLRRADRIVFRCSAEYAASVLFSACEDSTLDAKPDDDLSAGTDRKIMSMARNVQETADSKCPSKRRHFPERVD
jgi:hypothetical protein